MNGCVIAVVVVIGLTHAVSAQQRKPTHTLDLTKPDTRVTSPSRGSVSRGRGFSGQQTQTLPLAMELVRVDRDRYQFGSAIAYEIVLTNVGSNAIALPWSADLAAIEDVDTVFTRAIISLVLTDSSGTQHRIGSVVLDGSPRVPESLQQLAPGETASIKLQARTDLASHAAVALSSPNPQSVRTILNYQGETETAWHPVVSSNSLMKVFAVQ